MPHQCTSCSRVFDDGSKEMLSGCPDCGGNKFQFRPDGADAGVDAPEEAAEPPEPPEPTGSSSVARTVGKTARTVRNFVGSSDAGDPSIGADGPDDLGRADGVAASGEDTAQASARTDVVSPDELPTDVETETEHRFRPVSSDSDSDGARDASTEKSSSSSPLQEATAGPAGGNSQASSAAATEPVVQDAERPDLEELRAELNDQFESIKVLSPGHYELNLMELYDRDEYIIALQEDGRYSIQVPENFRD